MKKQKKKGEEEKWQPLSVSQTTKNRTEQFKLTMYQNVKALPQARKKEESKTISFLLFSSRINLIMLCKINNEKCLEIFKKIWYLLLETTSKRKDVDDDEKGEEEEEERGLRDEAVYSELILSLYCCYYWAAFLVRSLFPFLVYLIFISKLCESLFLFSLFYM